jgi:hypothetical protein
MFPFSPLLLFLPSFLLIYSPELSYSPPPASAPTPHRISAPASALRHRRVGCPVAPTRLACRRGQDRKERGFLLLSSLSIHRSSPILLRPRQHRVTPRPRLHRRVGRPGAPTRLACRRGQDKKERGGARWSRVLSPLMWKPKWASHTALGMEPLHLHQFCRAPG